jgi:ribose transport system substrate-binding protein
MRLSHPFSHSRGRRIFTAITISLLSIAVSAPTASSAAGDIGFSESFLTDAFQVQLVKQLGEQAKAQGATLLPAVDANGDAAKQSADVSTLLTRGIKGLIVVPVDSAAIVPAIEAANKAGVPVVTVDLGAKSGKIAMVVRADNIYMGKAACLYMAKVLKGKGTVLNLQGDLASANGQDRTKGFTTCMSAKFPKIKVISKPMKWQAALCTQQTQVVLSTRKIDGIFMGSESVCLAGVQQVMKAQKKLTKVGTKGHIVSVGIDGSPKALVAIRAGTLDATISQPLDLYAKYGIKYVIDAMNGKAFKAGPTDHGSVIVDLGKGTFSDLLPSPTITKANASDPKLWGNGK